MNIVWTTEKISYLRENSSKLTRGELAKTLGVSESSVANMIAKLGYEGKRKRRAKYRGCNETCPDHCPYDDCVRPANTIHCDLRELFGDRWDKE